ncbi:hypothetical protein GCM10023149_28610 [Mucilaginibacter gynuensis]|uniref:Uncharacterized protein n=1 Tax=Mucilaginibacter gynuensis TaxID=1302236 RepID=A0ABP8GKG5_9SPHI
MLLKSPGWIFGPIWADPGSTLLTSALQNDGWTVVLDQEWEKEDKKPWAGKASMVPALKVIRLRVLQVT